MPSVSPVTLYTKQHCAHKRCFIRHYRRDKWKWTNHSRLASRKWGVWKNVSLSESFGSHWASKVKINAYYKTMKVFLDLACMSTCCWGLPKPKYEPFITQNRGTLNKCSGWTGEKVFLVFKKQGQLWFSLHVPFKGVLCGLGSKQ